MDQQRILCTYLNHAPPDALTPSTLQVLPTLLLHTYNPEGLARCLVGTINRHLFVTKDSLGLSEVNIEDTQNYWSHIALVDCSGETTKPPQVSDPNIHVLLSTAYNEVIFAWITDFLLYPINKRVPQLIRRVRTRVSQAIPVPRYHREHRVVDVVDPIINVPGPEPDSSRKRRVYPLPRRTPPQPAAGNAHALDVNGRQADLAPGLDGCRVINDDDDNDNDETWRTPLSPVSAVGARTRRDSDSLLEEGLSQWDAHAVHLQPDEDLYGEALQMRTGKYREKLKRDIYRRDGASCAASASGPRGDLPDEPLFCTQIIPESADLDRYIRFRAMVSVFFSGQYDHLLESHPSSSTSGTPSHASPNGSVVDHSSAPPPTRRSRTSAQGPYPRPENILRSSLNAINLSEKWLRWFDEGRFVLREWGGQYYVKCLDPSLFHDPAFTRQGANPNDPWERGHGLRLDIGATPAAGATILPQQRGGGNTARHLDGPAPIPHHQQLPTPVPTPTSPAPVSPFYEHQRFGFGFSPTTSSTRYASGTPFHPGMSIAIRGTRSRNVNHLPRYHHRHVGSAPSTSSHSRRQTLSERELHSSTTPLTPISHSHLHAHSDSHATTSDIPGAVTLHPPSHEGSPRHPGPFVAGQASRRAYMHSRNTSNDSSSSKPSSRHSINALLNPATVPKLPPSVVSSVSAAVRAKGHDAKSSPYTHAVPLYAPPQHVPQPPAPLRAVRKELWDVDALDPRLVRLHEQIVTMWWATGLPTELAVQTHWVDSMPLEELNVFVLGEQMFAAVLLHKLKLL